MSLCCEILGWLPLDVKKLEEILDEYDIELDELLDYAKELDCDNDINCYIYSALKIAEEKIKEKLKEWLETSQVYDFLVNELNVDVYEKIDEFDANPYTNYIDSFFDSCFEDFNYLEPTKTDYWELIEGIFDVTEEEFEEWLKEEENE